MTPATLLLLSAVLLACLLAMYFIFCLRYEEGVFGNLMLGLGVLLPAILIAIDVVAHRLAARDLPRPVLWLLIGLIAFLLRHAWRHVMFYHSGKFAWLRPRDVQELGK